jgi:putative membrane protein
MSSLFAFLHHLAAFALVAALAAEFVLIKGELSVATARRLQRTDIVYGASAGAVFVIGLLRVFFFEKGADYYFHSVPFLAKLALFLAIGLLSIVPTIEFLSWSKALKEGRVPAMEDRKMRRIRSLIRWELVAVAALILCAALMARGVGYLG